MRRSAKACIGSWRLPAWREDQPATPSRISLTACYLESLVIPSTCCNSAWEILYIGSDYGEKMQQDAKELETFVDLGYNKYDTE